MAAKAKARVVVKRMVIMVCSQKSNKMEDWSLLLGWTRDIRIWESLASQITRLCILSDLKYGTERYGLDKECEKLPKTRCRLVGRIKECKIAKANAKKECQSVALNGFKSWKVESLNKKTKPKKRRRKE